MKNIPAPRSANDKYGLYEMDIDSHKDFSLCEIEESEAKKLYNNIRLSAWYYGKTYKRNYVTRKMPNESGDVVIRVFRKKLSRK